VTQFNKTSDRLDKVEKAQGEPTARLAKLSDEVSKLRAAQAAAAAPPAMPSRLLRRWYNRLPPCPPPHTLRRRTSPEQ